MQMFTLQNKEVTFKPSYIIIVIIFNIVVCIHACIYGHMHRQCAWGPHTGINSLIFHPVQPRQHAMTLNVNIHLLHIRSTNIYFFFNLCEEEDREEDK